jgi:hypothetical protein
VLKARPQTAGAKAGSPPDAIAMWRGGPEGRGRETEMMRKQAPVGGECGETSGVVFRGFGEGAVGRNRAFRFGFEGYSRRSLHNHNLLVVRMPARLVYAGSGHGVGQGRGGGGEELSGRFLNVQSQFVLGYSAEDG